MGYWLTDWLDEVGADTMHRLDRVLSDRTKFASLREVATSALPTLEAPLLQGEGLVAASGIDLSGALDCAHIECRMKQVDALLAKVWHYFDQVTIADRVCRALVEDWKRPTTNVVRIVRDQALIAMHLRTIGAESLTVFQDKPLPRACTKHWRLGTEGTDLSASTDTVEMITDVVARDASISEHKRTATARGTEIEFAVSHPFFEHSEYPTLDDHLMPTENTEWDLRRAVAQAAVAKHVLFLASDLNAAKKARAALGASTYLHRRLLTDAPSEMTEHEVAFNIPFPVVSGIDLKSLLSVRKGEREYFERFRSALRKAVAERRRSAATGDPKAVGREIYRDVVEPELTRLRGRLNRSKNALARKASVGLSVSALTTTVGLLAGTTPAVAVLAGTTALGAALYNASAKYVDDDGEAKLSSMYFLWKATHGH